MVLFFYKHYKKIILILCIFSIISICQGFYIKPGDHSNITLNNFAFGSCFTGRHSTRLDIFKTIDENDPDLWLWLGDAAYVDKVAILDYWKSNLDVNFTIAEELFNKSKFNEFYEPMSKKIPTIGVWDDHDFAINDGNGYFSHKEVSKKLYLDFVDEPEDSERRIIGRGIYTTYSFGEKKTHKTVRMILLDVRFNKTSLIFDTNPDILGEDQWQWFEEVLANSDETFIFISSGTQILPFNRFLSEAWYGTSRKRLFDLIAKYKKSGVILLTGDIHCAQLLKTFCTLPEIGYDLYEVTSSGLSHYLRIKWLMDYVLPADYNIVPTIETYNFAKLDFVWGLDRQNSAVEVSLIDADNILRTKMTIPYSQLVFNDTRIKDPECSARINSRFKSVQEYVNYYWNNKLEVILLVPYLWIIWIIYYSFYFCYWITKKWILFIVYIFTFTTSKVKNE